MVNVGSGVSILKIDKNIDNTVKCERVGGTCLGGGEYL
jgi:pantothenate kinase